MSEEAMDYVRERLARENQSIRETAYCTCRKPIEGPRYMRHASCRLCGKLRRKD